jgi:hypothetical protein
MVYFHTKFRISNANSPLANTIKPYGKHSRDRHAEQKETPEYRMHAFTNYWQKS